MSETKNLPARLEDVADVMLAETASSNPLLRLKKGEYYVGETGSAALRSRLESEDAVIASELARVELMSVFHRRMRERAWTREQFQTAVNQLGRDDTAQYWTWVPVSSFIIGAASQLYLSLPENVFLRASDCLHL